MTRIRPWHFLAHWMSRSALPALTVAVCCSVILANESAVFAECTYSIATSQQMTAITQNVGGSAWSPDGKRIAFVRQEPVVSPEGNIWVLNVEDPLAPPLRLTNGGTAGSPNIAWSRDGSHILYDGGCGIERVASDGSGTPETVLCSGGNANLNVATSRLFYGVSLSGIGSVLVDDSGVAQPGTEVTIASGLPAALVQPASSPDSDTLLFVRIGTGPNLAGIIYRLDGVLDIVAGNTTAVTSLADPRISVFRNSGKFVSGPQFSLSGELVYFNEGLLDSTTFLGDSFSGAGFPGEDVGTDQMPLDPTDENGNFVLDEASAGEWNGVLDAGEDRGLDAAPLDPFDNGSGQSSMISDNDGVTSEPSLGEDNEQLDTGISIGNRLQTIVARLDGTQTAQVLGNNGFLIGVAPDGTRLSFTRRTWEGPLGTAKSFLNWDLFIGSVRTTCLVPAGSGGTVIDGSGTTLTVPAGSMEADTSITIETPPVDLVPATPIPLALARIYGPSGTTFSPPATISFHYTDEQVSGFDESTLILSVYNSGTESWEDLPTTIDSIGNILTASVAHFSPVVVLGEPSCSNGLLDPEEACDDGDTESGDGCDANCTVTACGNGIATIGEACDDGNTAGGDCCSPTCQYEAQYSPCDDGRFCTIGELCSATGICAGSANPCDDTNVCTADSCDDDLDTCLHSQYPRDQDSCLAAPGTKFQIKNSDADGKDRLSWKWTRGAAFAIEDLGTPQDDTTYTLCIHDRAGTIPSLRAAIEIDPSSVFWTASEEKGLSYKDPDGTSAGVTKATLRTGIDGKTFVKISAGGTNLTLPLPADPVYFHGSPNVVVQLVNGNGTCWTSAFEQADMKSNEADSFKAQTK